MKLEKYNAYEMEKDDDVSFLYKERLVRGKVVGNNILFAEIIENNGKKNRFRIHHIRQLDIYNWHDRYGINV